MPVLRDKVVNFLKPFAGDSEIEVSGDFVEFSADPDSQIAKLVAKIGREKVEDTINDWLDDNTTGGITRISPPNEPGAAESMVTPRAKRVVMDDPEDTDEEPEYDSALPPTPVMGDDEDRYYPRSSMRPSFTDDDEDDGGDSDYTPGWAREEEESSEDPVCDECDGRGGKEYPFQGEMEYDVCRQCDGSGKSRFSKYSKGDDEEEEHGGARMDLLKRENMTAQRIMMRTLIAMKRILTMMVPSLVSTRKSGVALLRKQ
jgi:hypothetical protein